MILRRATPDDAAEGARFHARCWREAYAGLLPADKLDAAVADIEGRIRAWRRLIDAGPPRWLAVDEVGGGRVIAGFACAGPARDEGMDITELHSIYAARSHWGKGVGAALLDRAIGAQPAYLWVLEGNNRAIRFYEKHGFAFDGSTKFDPRYDRSDLRMTRGDRSLR